MTATARFKQLLFLMAGLALVLVGLTGLTPAAQADDTGEEECIPTEDQVITQWFETDPGAPWVATGNSRVKTAGTDPTLSAWVDEGDVIRTEENVAPADPDGTDEASFTNLIRFVFVGQTDPEVITPAVPGQHYSWNGGNRGVDDPPLGNVPPNEDWTPNVTGFDPHLQGEGDPATWFPVDPATSGLHVTGNSPSNASWFYFVPGTDAVTDIDYLWQKQVRTVVPGTDPVLEFEYTKTIEGQECEDDDDDDEEVCPKGTDHADEDFPVAGDPESCNDDDPIIEPGEGENPGPGNNPGNNPSNNPGNSPSNNPGSNPQGSNQPNNGVTPVQAPGAQVPSAVDAGLAPTPRDLTGTGGGLNLLGLGIALLGAGLVGAAFRPRRRVEAGGTGG